MNRQYVFSSLGALAGLALVVYLFGYSSIVATEYTGAAEAEASSTTPAGVTKPQFDVAAYEKKLAAVANCPTKQVVATATSTDGTVSTSTSTIADPQCLWPAKTAVPKLGALLPFNRILAYYGNFYSTGMGVLGQYPEDVMLAKLKAAVAEWQAADPSTPVIPAIEYIDVTAQGSPGKDGKYRLRMPDTQVDKALEIAKKADAIVILDIQVGLSTLQQEIPLLEKYWKMPNVHLALDPEFAMHGGAKPGTVIGSLDAADINYAINYLSKIVQENDLPPKILVVHRFTNPMVTNYKNIKPTPEVQVVMDMDGWGSPERKIGTYNAFIAPQPVQFTGFKLFYKNDLKPPSKRLLTPAELLKLTPQPLFIQYQ